MADDMREGGGGRFRKMVKGMEREGMSEDSAEAAAASAGRKKYGKKKFQKMAAKGHRRAMRRRTQR